MTELDLTLEITRECPLRCSICSSNASERDLNELPKHRWLEIISSAARLGFTEVCFSGGEPLASPFLSELLSHAKGLGLIVTIYTSGNILVNGQSRTTSIDPMMSTLVRYADRLAFGIQGSDETSHDSITGVRGSFLKLMNSIALARDAGLVCSGHFVPTKTNYHLTPNIIGLSQRAGLSYLGILRFVPQGRGQTNRTRLELTSQDLSRFRNILVALSHQQQRFIRLGAPFSFLGLGTDSTCTLGRRMTVQSNGIVAPCEALKDYAVEKSKMNLWMCELEEIWKNEILCSPIVTSMGAKTEEWICPAIELYLTVPNGIPTLQCRKLFSDLRSKNI